MNANKAPLRASPVINGEQIGGPLQHHMNTFCELLSFLVLPLEEKCRFVPAPRTQSVRFDLVSGHLRTAYPLHFLVSLSVDVFSTERYVPADLQERDSQAFTHLLGLMHLMLWCSDDRIWDTRSLEGRDVDNYFGAVWSLLQCQAVSVAKELGLVLGPPTIDYETLKLDWAGKPEPDGPADVSQPIGSEKNRTSSTAGSRR